MNQGHELLVRGDDVSLRSALDAYTEAITLLRSLPLGENPGWANSLAAALMNRGQLLHRLHGVEQATVALLAFEEATVLLRPLAGVSEPWPRRNLTGTLLNRANLQLDLGQFIAAAEDARDALFLSMQHERTDPLDAELSLKARRALSDALGQLITQPGLAHDELAREASDVVDDALALIRLWHKRGATGLRELTLRFFHFGCQLYRFHQPHFLAEFIEENLQATDPDFRQVALGAIDAALQDHPHDREFLTIGDPVSERRRLVWQQLQQLRASLAA